MGFWRKLFGLESSSGTRSSSAAKRIFTIKPYVGTGNPDSNPVPAPASPNKGNWMDAVEDDESENGNLTVYDMNGNPLQLGSREEQASGGEGTVYTLPKNSNILIKVYKSDTLKNTAKMAEVRKRIMDMIRVHQCGGMEFLAWPLMPVMDAKKDLIGFAMRKCKGSSFLTFRKGPEKLRQSFPGWDRRKYTEIALDYVIKLKRILAQNVLVNDFNPANFLVDGNGNVSFIDCDSFQVPAWNGGVHLTKTYFASHAAPELLTNKPLLNQPRNVHQVEFSAALTVFNILMFGQHPYSYYDPSHQSACGNPDENLVKGRCPLGIGADCRFPAGPWYNLWSYFTGSLKSCFITTFRDGHSYPAKRATLDQLEAELRKMIFVMDRDPKRREMNPKSPKPRGDKQSSSEKS